MKNYIFISIAVATLIIGIHQAMTNGITESYWLFMFSVCFLLLHQYVKKKGQEGESKRENDPEKAQEVQSSNQNIAGEGKLARKMRRKKSRVK